MHRPVADTYVRSSSPSSNYGTATRLYVENFVKTSYLRFDLRQVTGPIAKATLRLYAGSSNSKGFRVAAVSSNTWSETSVTYSNAPATGSPGPASGPVSAGTWVSLDVTSLVTSDTQSSLALSSEQISWLKNDLASDAHKCTLAFMHRARFSSGPHGSSTGPLEAWKALCADGAELVLAGHDHLYERFAPQDPNGTSTSTLGPRPATDGAERGPTALDVQSSTEQ